MPWTPKSFAARHNKKLKKSPKKAKKAAEMATAMVREGMDEGKAIRIANAHAKKRKRKKNVK